MGRDCSLRRRVLLRSLCAGAGAWPDWLRAADDGITADAITISRVIALEGPAGAKGREQEAALRAYFEAINAGGGIHGRRIALQTANEDLRTEDALRRILAQQRPFALFLFGGTTGSSMAMAHASAGRIPFVAPNSGASVFHDPANRYVFNVRARYRDEVIAALRHFALVSQQRVALVHVDDAFGRDGAEGYREGVRQTAVTSVYEGSFAAAETDFSQQARALADARPHAVVCIGSSRRVAEFIAAARASGVSAVFMTLSNNSSAGFARELGVHARGVIVSQVTPPPGNHSTAASRELRRLLAGRPEADVSYAAMEAYLSAKVLVEGLKRAGSALTREGFVQALESLRRHDLGGIEVGYGPGRRTGSAYVELSMLTDDGRYRR
ncbi:ABC transporter substrate-binding protein [Schlegelella sp. S2-27]|uniref:ABC transporter substrate-binding protein n=1 Tax=Caldimonas mangrovi TaxID=2944811 RepID=A0ABT0YRC6_9BURK|nr:ABC transporter substrate-binding protein [Caldimonas mangrovi]MCM5681280.1 ABC transporter substrate-binding protein [Caldimonas mangrovi]